MEIRLIDENENIIFHSYVTPPIPVTNFRYETTGIRHEYLRDAMPLKLVQRKIQEFLCNGEPIWTIRSRGGKARILVGHGLDHDLASLQLVCTFFNKRGLF
jgi:DNA polymerase III epsilon subunit-like protein